MTISQIICLVFAFVCTFKAGIKFVDHDESGVFDFFLLTLALIGAFR